MISGVRQTKEKFMDERWDFRYDGRKMLNKTNSAEYWSIQNNIRRKIREVKENKREEQCIEIEFHQRNYDDFNVHRKVREVTGRFWKKNYEKLVDPDGLIIVIINEKTHIWKTYLENLFHDVKAEQEHKIGDRTALNILLDEVESAIKQLEGGKASSLD